MGIKAITVRGIDDEMSSKLKQIAKRENKSVNRFILDLIKENIGMKKNIEKKNILNIIT